MKRKWDYATLAHDAKKNGGPEQYIKTIQKYGFQKGIMTMFPVCITSCIVAYKKGPQIIGFIKGKLGLITKKDVEYAKEQLRDTPKEPAVECSVIE